MNCKKFLLVTVLFLYNSLNAQSQVITELIEKVSKEKIEEHVENLCWADGYESRVSFTEGNTAAANYIYNYLSSLPIFDTVLKDTFYINSADSPYNEFPLLNIIGVINGSEPDSGIVLTGGHYDASGSRDDIDYNTNWQTIKAQGADDNATGIATMLEIARVFSDNQQKINLRNTVKFIAFGAEEYHPVHSSVHHAGSLWDAERSYRNKEKIKAAIILDMIGYNPNYNYVEAITDAKSDWLTELSWQNASLYDLKLRMNDETVDVPYSDHESYQYYGYSALLLMENDRPWNNDFPYYRSNSYYHTDEDVFETVNFEQVLKVTKLSLSMIAELATSENLTDIFTFEDPENAKTYVSTYPNPFNSTVNFNFAVHENGKFSMEIYDLLGRKVSTLISDKQLNKGIFQTSWNADNFSSGIFFMILKKDGIVMNKSKLMLMK